MNVFNYNGWVGFVSFVAMQVDEWSSEHFMICAVGNPNGLMRKMQPGCLTISFDIANFYMFVILLYCRWTLIAGRIPGRKPEEIERFWIMKHGEAFADKRELRELAEI